MSEAELLAYAQHERAVSHDLGVPDWLFFWLLPIDLAIAQWCHDARLLLARIGEYLLA